jgi:hypothetical protein
MRLKVVILAFAMAIGMGVAVGTIFSPTPVTAGPVDDCNGCRK